MATPCSLSIPGFKLLPWQWSSVGCWFPGISPARTWWGSNHPKAMIKQSGLRCPALAAEWARSASESSNTVTLTLDEFQHSGKYLSQTVVCPCINWVLFCGSLFSFFFFQALYIKAVSPCLFFRTSESRVSNFESIAGFCEGKQPALRVCVTLEQDTRRESRTVPEQQKLQTKPGGYGKSVTVKNTTQPMPPPYELIALGRGSTMGFGRLDSFWSELHQSTAINTGNNPVSKLPGLYLSVFPGPEQ